MMAKQHAASPMPDQFNFPIMEGIVYIPFFHSARACPKNDPVKKIANQGTSGNQNSVGLPIPPKKASFNKNIEGSKGIMKALITIVIHSKPIIITVRQMRLHRKINHGDMSMQTTIVSVIGN